MKIIVQGDFKDVNYKWENLVNFPELQKMILTGQHEENKKCIKIIENLERSNVQRQKSIEELKKTIAQQRKSYDQLTLQLRGKKNKKK